MLAKVDLITKKQGCKGNILGTNSTGYFAIVFILLIEVVALYMGATLVQVGVPCLENPTLSYGICFAMFLILNK